MNNTTKYLYSFYNNFGKEFTQIYNSQLKVLQLYIGDRKYKDYDNFTNGKDFRNDNILFIAVDKRSLAFDKSLIGIQGDKHYVADYAIDDTKHMLVVELTGEHKIALNYFKRSQYSKMYPVEVLNKTFITSKSWIAKYGMTEDEVTKQNCNDLIGEQFNYHQLKLSRYHVMTKSKELRELLECIYNCSIGEDTELMEKIRLNKEVLNYE